MPIAGEVGALPPILMVPVLGAMIEAPPVRRAEKWKPGITSLKFESCYQTTLTSPCSGSSAER
jgi:hypothetical protein